MKAFREVATNTHHISLKELPVQEVLVVTKIFLGTSSIRHESQPQSCSQSSRVDILALKGQTWKHENV